MKIENTWKILAFVIEAGNVLPAMKMDASYLEKLIALGRLTDELAGLGGVDWGEVKSEILGLSGAEKSALIERAVDKYDIENDKMEAEVEKWIALVIRQVDIFADGYNLLKAK